jgi:MFS family permease
MQGFGAAFLTSGALPLVLPLFPESKAPRVIGTWGAIGSVAAWLTPTLGGALVEANWRLAYAAIVPIGMAAFALGARVLPEHRPDVQNPLRIDRLGILFGPPGFGLAMLVLSQGRRWGWTSRPTIQLAVAATLLIVVFGLRCRRHPSPLLDLSLFSNREFSANVGAGMLQQVGFFSFFITAPLIMTQVWGWSARQAGLGLALSQVLATVGSISAGHLVERVGPYPVLIIGALINSAGSLWLVITATESITFWTGYVPAALMLGFGASWCGTVTSGSGLAALGREALGLGNSAQQLLRRAGGSIGVALAVALLGDGRGADLLPGAKRVWWMGVIVHLLIGIPLLAVPHPFARHRRTRSATDIVDMVR